MYSFVIAHYREDIKRESRINVADLTSHSSKMPETLSGFRISAEPYGVELVHICARESDELWNYYFLLLLSKKANKK